MLLVPGANPLPLLSILFIPQMLTAPVEPEKPQKPENQFYSDRTGRIVSFSGPASAIVDRKVARSWFTARRMYALNKRRADAAGDFASVSVGEAASRLAGAMAEYGTLGADVHARWEQRAREHDARQPGILEAILSVLEADPTRSFEQVASDVGDWCSGSTIRRFFASLSYSSVLERVLPLMTALHRRKGVEFARHFRNNWGRGKGKYLLIHLDEKWFYGMLLRHAKVCEALGLVKTHLYARHGNYLNKVLMLAVVGVAFTDSLENGGRGVRLGIHRAEAAKIAQQRQNETRTDPTTGQVTRPSEAEGGRVVRNAGDTFWVDCEVTGSTSATSTKPKFSLLKFLRDILFPQVEAIVGEGGVFAGYTPIFQWDNAGPHSDKTLVSFAEAFCAARGWGWEPQAAQMPFSNVLDLLVFPKLSRQHAHLVRTSAGRSVGDKDVIWRHAKNAYWDLSSVDIATGFVLAHRLMKKVIDANGGNHFLDEGGVHSDVRRDFVPTADGQGVRRKDEAVVPAP